MDAACSPQGHYLIFKDSHPRKTESQTNSGVLQLAGSSNRRLDGLNSAEGGNDDGRRGTIDGLVRAHPTSILVPTD